jgi:hypothetical protein
MRLLRNANLVSTVAVTLLTGAAWGAVPPVCTPPPGFKDTRIRRLRPSTSWFPIRKRWS